MYRKNLLTILVAGAALVALPESALSQEASRQDVTAQAFGSFVTGTTQNGIDHNESNSGGVLGTYRYFFSTHHGVEANYGYSRNNLSYAGLPGVNTNSHEISGAYVFRMPLKNLTPFALAGAGALVFDPRNFAGANTQTRAAFVYGAGADFSVSRHIFMRAEYRGLVYNSPTYDLRVLAGLDRVSHRAEPSIGFGYRF